MTQIERGEMLPDTLRKSIEIYTKQITTELLETSISVESENSCICPKCKSSPICFYPKIAKCVDANCGLVVFRNISQKELSDKQITELLTKGKTAVIKGFKSKAGKLFDACLKFDDNFRVTFEFQEKKQTKGEK